MKTLRGRTETLWQVLLKLGGNASAEQVLTEALEIVCEETGAGEITLWLYHDAEKQLVAAVHAGDSSIVGTSVSPDHSLVGRTFQTGEEIWIPDTSKHPSFPAGRDEETGIPVRNNYLLSMRLGGKITGCLQAINRTAGEYSDEEKAILRSFCGLAAMAAEEKGLVFPGRSDRKVLVSLHNAVKEYASGGSMLRVLKDVNLEIYEHELLIILGESGCGKSTLLNILGGMDCLTSGEMTVDGRVFSHPTEKELTEYRRDAIGFVFQAYHLMPNLTALENIEFIAENTPNAGNAQEALDRVHLGSVANHYPSMMSGGQQQRVAIARAIVKNPRMILADEPTGALDYATGKEVLQIIEKLVREEKTTVVMVTHNAEIARMADRVIRLRDGRISSIQENAHPRSADELVW